METQNSEVKPGLPVPLPEKPEKHFHPNLNVIYDRDYFLYFSKGNKSDFKMFHFNGTFTEAMQRAKDHCRTMQIRFLYITPALTDLDEQEKKFLKVPYQG